MEPLRAEPTMSEIILRLPQVKTRVGLFRSSIYAAIAQKRFPEPVRLGLRYREAQEDQLGALGLVVNLIVVWNTIYMDVALNQLRAEGYEVPP